MLRWSRDDRVETTLRQLGFKVDIETVNFDQIDLEEGLRRQARMLGKGLDQNHVISLGIAMSREGAKFPMGVLQKPPGRGARYWPWSANHRLAAIKELFRDPKKPEEYIESVDAYVITVTDPMMLDFMPRYLNTVESTLGYSKDERVAQARWMIENHSMKVEEAAKFFGVKKEWIYKANASEVTLKAVEGIPGAEKLSKTLREKMYALINHVEVLKRMARIFCHYGVGHTDSLAVIAAVRSHDSESKMMSELERWETIFEQRQRPLNSSTLTDSTNNNQSSSVGAATKTTKTKTRKPGTSATPTIVISKGVRDIILKYMTSLAELLKGKHSLMQLQITEATDMAVLERAWKTVKNAMAEIEDSSK